MATFVIQVLLLVASAFCAHPALAADRSLLTTGA
jgi:hypothetical protein